MTTTEALLALQETDIERMRATAKLKALPHFERLKLIETTQKRVKAELLKIIGDRKDLETDLDELEQTVMHYEQKREEVLETSKDANFRDTRSLDQQLSSLAKHIEKCEFKMVGLRSDLEHMQKAQRGAEATLAKLDAAQSATSADLADKSSGLQELLAELAQRRSDLLDELDPAIVARYEKASKRFGGLAVERLVHNVPSICRVALQPSSYHDLIHGPEIGECPYCHRMLVTEE